MNAEQNLTSNESPTSFNDLLSKELALLNGLKDLMLNEKTAVEENKIEQLIPIADDKQKILELVEKASIERQRFLRSHSVGQTGLEMTNNYIHRADDSQQLRTIFNTLQSTLKECQDLNNTNAKIIAMNQRHVERNLNIIKGVDDKSVVYTSKGNTESSQSRLNGVKA